MLTAISRLVGVSVAAVTVVGLLGGSLAHSATTAPTPQTAPELSQTQAAQALQVLEDPQKRSEVIATLKALAATGAASPAPAAPTAPVTPHAAAPTGTPTGAPTAAPTGPAPAAPTPPADKKITLAPNSLGAALLVSASGFMSHLWSEALMTTRTIQSVPLLWGWLVVMATNPLAHTLLREAFWRVALAGVCGLALRWLVARLLRRPISILEGHAGPAPSVDRAAHDRVTGGSPDAIGSRRHRRVAAATLLRRLPLVLIRFVLDLLPVAGFALGGHIMAATPLGGSEQTQLIVLAMIDAYAITLAVLCFTRMLVSPEVGRLRLLQVSDAAAAWVITWVRRLTVVAVFGYAIAEVGLLLGMSTPAHDGLIKIAGFINHVFLGIMVLQKRRTVRRWLRAPAEATGAAARARNALASSWHQLALFFLIVSWFVWAIELRNGFARLFDLFVVLILVAIGARLVLIVLLGAAERALHPSTQLLDRYPGLEARIRVYHPIIASLIRGAVYLVALVVLLELWGVPLTRWFEGNLLGERLVAGLGAMALTVILALAVWEAVNAAMEAHLARLSREQQVAKSARMRTLMPLLRTTLLTTVLVVAGLIILSEIGINIAPLLAGAGIIGVAIGFGSQKLVQDLITGIFLLLENAMQVGDWVTVSGLSGTVENLSVRTIRLRAGDGSVHIIPFSAVTSVTNTNRGLGNAAVSISVDYGEDTDSVIGELKQIAALMRKEPDYASRMLSDIQIWGVDKVDGASVTIAGQIPCTDSGRWPVQREFNRRVKARFQELGITIFNPLQTYVVPPMQALRQAQLPPQEKAAE